MEWLEFPGVVAILPVTGDGRIVLVEQYRAPIDRVTIEVPAGALNPGETPVEGARRELAEETGYRAARLEPLASFYPAIGYSSERITLFKATGLAAGETRFDDGEDINVILRTPAEVEGLIANGSIADSKSIIAYMTWRFPATVSPRPDHSPIPDRTDDTPP